MAEVLAPFKVSVSDQVLTDLRSRLAVARIPAPPPGEAWSQGTDPEFLRRLRDYWLNEFDWRGAEAKLNSLDQFTTSIDDVDIHFIHQRSPHPEALPLVVSHGWPGSIAEFHKIIGPLTNPTAYGADAGDAFHVVCPSLPGHGFSGAPKEPGWDLRRIAGAFVQLMARLGYDRYGAQGGDWGAVISTHIADLDPSHTVGIHLNIVPTLPPEDDPMAGVLPEEAAQLQDFQQFQRQETGYQEIHRTKPQTLGSALNDSPLGLAAWIVEKFRSWTDCDGDVERAITFDELLTNITIYWVTETITPSMRLYLEADRAGGSGLLRQRVEVPVGCAIFPKELLRPPRAWAERAFNLVHWQSMPRGGHFAALEQPELLVEDIRTFFRPLR